MSKLEKQSEQFSLQQVTEREVRGVSMRLLTINRSLELCARMNYETEVLDVIESMPQGSTFMDLGACEGRFSIFAALLGQRVVAIEPEQRNFDTLLQNLSLNSLGEDHILPFKVAVGDRNAQAVLEVGQPWEGGHQKVLSLDQGRSDLDFDPVETQTVDVVRLDDFLLQNKLPKPHTLKVDIDGAEIAFLKGAESTLAEHSLRCVIFELLVDDPGFGVAIETMHRCGLNETARYPIPNESNLFNIVFHR